MIKLRATHSIFGILILILFSSSCASDLDYNQVYDIKLEPVWVANLAYFDIPANKFVTGGVEENVIFDAPDFDVFRDTFFRDNLKRADLFFEVDNTINRGYRIDLVFLDSKNQPVYFTNFNVPAYTGTENREIKTVVFENARLDSLKRTTKIIFILTLFTGGPPLNENSTGSLKLRSGVTAYFVVK